MQKKRRQAFLPASPISQKQRSVSVAMIKPEELVVGELRKQTIKAFCIGGHGLVRRLRSGLLCHSGKRKSQSIPTSHGFRCLPRSVHRRSGIRRGFCLERRSRISGRGLQTRCEHIRPGRRPCWHRSDSGRCCGRTAIAQHQRFRFFRWRIRKPLWIRVGRRQSKRTCQYWCRQ